MLKNNGYFLNIWSDFKNFLAKDAKHGGTESMKIKEAATITHFTEHTLRYYERIGLLKISKDMSGHRNYTEDDISWIEFINRLRTTSMPIKDIMRYSELRIKGDDTVGDRLQLLEAHENRINDDIKRLEFNLVELKKKIECYKMGYCR